MQNHTLLVNVILFIVVVTIILVCVLMLQKRKQARTTTYDVTEYKYDIYVINLARRRDRMVKFGANYDFGMPYKILDAVDGRNLDLQQLERNGTVGRIALDSIKQVNAGKGRKHHYEIGSVGAIGCTLSHMNAWRQSQPTGNSLIVFEDDAIVSGIKVDDLDARIKSLPEDWHIYLIGRPHTMYTALRVDKTLVKVQRFCGLHAYVVSQKGKEFLSSQNGKMFPINQQLDSHLSELCLDYGLNVYAHTNAHMFVNGDNTTDIQVSNQGNPIDDKRLMI